MFAEANRNHVVCGSKMILWPIAVNSGVSMLSCRWRRGDGLVRFFAVVLLARKVQGSSADLRG